MKWDQVGQVGHGISTALAVCLIKTANQDLHYIFIKTVTKIYVIGQAEWKEVGVYL